MKAASSAFLGTLNVTMPDLEQVREITVEGCVRDVTKAPAGKASAAASAVPAGEAPLTLAEPVGNTCTGELAGSMENGLKRVPGDMALASETTACAGGRLYGEQLTFTVYPASWRIGPEAFAEGGSVTEAESGRVILPPLTGENREALERAVEEITGEGRTAVLAWGADKDVEFTLQGANIRLQKCPEVFFAASEEAYKKYSLNMLYNAEKGYIDVLAGRYVDTGLQGNCQVYTYSKQGFDDSRGAKKKLPFVLEIPAGRGKLVAVSLKTAGRTGVNANLDALLRGR